LPTMKKRLICFSAPRKLKSAEQTTLRPSLKMSLKNFAYLTLRSRGYSPLEALRIINIAIRSGAGNGVEFEAAINICQECHGKGPIF
jgi:hypothetical protein